jgi:S-adenosylmethionine:tRNA ribosyltransferase-isomerase
LATGKLHHETYEITKNTADNLKLAKSNGKRIIAVGTTTTRTIETLLKITESRGETDLFIYPPYKFKFTDSLITNFHLPQSSLLMLVTALTSSPNTLQKFTDFKSSLIGQAYLRAVKSGYRFFSFGDAMWIK